MNTRTDERTPYEAMGDIAYNCRYYLLQGRLFGKLAGAFQLVTFVSGSAAFAGFLGSNPKLAGLAALVTAAITGLDFIISPARKAYQQTAANALHQVAKSMSEKLVLNKGSAGHTFGTLPASHPDHPEHPDFEPSKK